MRIFAPFVMLLIFALTWNEVRGQGTAPKQQETESEIGDFEDLEFCLPEANYKVESKVDCETVELTLPIKRDYVLIATLDRRQSPGIIRRISITYDRWGHIPNNVKRKIGEDEFADATFTLGFNRYGNKQITSDAGGHRISCKSGFFIVRKVENGVVVRFIDDESYKCIARWFVSAISQEDVIALLPKSKDSFEFGFDKFSYASIQVSPLKKFQIYEDEANED